MKRNVKNTAFLFAIFALIVFIGIVAIKIQKNNDSVTDNESNSLSCGHDLETYVEPTLQNGKYYLKGDTSSPYCFEISGTNFIIFGDIDPVIDNFNIPYNESPVSASEFPPANSADDENVQTKQYPTYEELCESLKSTMRTEIFTVHELDDEIIIYVFNGNDKIFGFDYISDREFAAADQKYILVK